MNKITLLIIFSIFSTHLFSQSNSERNILHAIKINDHKVVLDEDHKIISWITPQSNAYNEFLHQRWSFFKNEVQTYPGTSYPEYFFSCGFSNQKYGTPSGWMNDIGEKIPNLFESARLYYAYCGDTVAMNLVKDLIDYTLIHGTSPSDFAWPNFPYTTTNAGDLWFRGFTDHDNLHLHEIQVDHAGDMGLTYFRMYQFTDDEKYLKAAINVADVLSKYAKVGNEKESVWPYRVIMSNGKITAPYGANWTGCYMLLENLIRANLGNVEAYRSARNKAKDFFLKYPMKTGYWTDGHSDTDVNSNTYKSNLSASNMKLCLFDYPELDPNWKLNIPQLIKWTEVNFVDRCNIGEPSTQWGANIVGEQDSFLPKMDYQTARYGAECARWYAVTGDESYKEKAYRSLNWVTYCNDSDGMAYESPVSVGVETWWSDTYGECPRMFYHAMAGVPEWAPPGENHILYTEGILKNVIYTNKRVQYYATNKNGTDFLRVAFKPTKVSFNNDILKLKNDTNSNEAGYTLKDLGNNDYSLIITRNNKGTIIIE
jgi:hypothetical protein